MALINERISLYHYWVGKVEYGNREKSYHGNIGHLEGTNKSALYCVVTMLLLLSLLSGISDGVSF